MMMMHNAIRKDDMPLSDCTHATLQAANCMNGPSSRRMLDEAKQRLSAKKMCMTHDPYAGSILAPEDSVNSCADMTPSVSCATSPMECYSPLMSWQSSVYSNSSELNRYAQPFTPYSTPAMTSGYGMTNNNYALDASLPNVRRSLFQPLSSGINSHDSSAQLEGTMGSHQGSSVKTTSPRTMWATEMVVELRCGEAHVCLTDLNTVFPSVVEAEEAVGRYVVVEGDRGEDMGEITSIVRRVSTEHKNANKEELDEVMGLPKVLRASTELDMQVFMELDHAEAAALEHCHACLEQIRLDPPIEIKDAIFQFDRKKLTIKYTSDAYVDFNVLTRQLHTTYKCRIWMHQLNRDVRPATGATAAHEKRFREVRRGKKPSTRGSAAAGRRRA